MEVALIAAAVTALGWLVSHLLTSQRELRNQRLAARLKYTERQLEELYGPLAILVAEGRRTFEELLAALGRRYVFHGDAPLPKNELAMWLFWAENDLMPRNERIKGLLMAKTHLVEGGAIPDSYLRFLDHHNAWAINHLRWTKEKIAYSWHSSTNWPADFASEVLATFHALKARHAQAIEAVSGRPNNEMQLTRSAHGQAERGPRS